MSLRARAVLVSAVLVGGCRVPGTGVYTCVRTAPFHPAIHNLGNVGALGSVHASGAHFATWLIDQVAYRGRHMRREVAEGLAKTLPSRARVLEVGCGVGTLTRELVRVDLTVVGVDTSEEMLEVARRCVPSAELLCENGADVQARRADAAICTMVFHELPCCAHVDVLEAMIAATELAQGDVWLVDIDPTYEPSAQMLAGEPYVPEYLATIDATLARTAEKHSLDCTSVAIVQGHVRTWVLTRRPE
jgi:SAM-dependent methyltransferase